MKHTGAGLDHLRACEYCPRSDFKGNCLIYTQTKHINRRGGCPYFPERDMPPSYGRVGQQKHKHDDRKYASKNDRRRKF